MATRAARDLREPSARAVLWRVLEYVPRGKTDVVKMTGSLFVEARLFFDARKIAQLHFGAERVELEEAPEVLPYRITVLSCAGDGSVVSAERISA